MKLSIKNLNKQYSNGVKALDNLSLEIGWGMFGLLGPNGAGKSTLMRTIATLQDADSGSMEFNGLNILQNPDELRRQLGYLPQEFGVYPKISAFDMLHHIAILKGIKGDVKELVNDMLNQVNLYEHKKKNVSEFSGGMRQRFGIGQALIGNPNILIVDEPTAGLDPTERNRFHNILSAIAENKIVILSTHIVQDVIELCNDMAIINLGQLKYNGHPNNALDILKDKVFTSSLESYESSNLASTKILSTRLLGGKPFVNFYSEDKLGSPFETKRADLEDVFFYHCQA